MTERRFASISWRLERAVSRLALRRGVAVTIVAVTAFVLHAGISLFVRMPAPRAHDEFGYLLQADTFARGRLTNPSHPLWVHFESFHIFFQPTYNAIYPPGQGMLLAVGQIIAGRPIVGSWLGVAAACGAICWMLMGWMRPRWAFVGGLIAIGHWSLMDWGQSFWGGSVAVFGGVLVIGAWRRIVRQPRARDAFIMGVGMFVLANTRPYEGMVLGLIAVVSLAVWMFRHGWHRSADTWLRLGLPVVGMVTLAVGAVGYYNWRVTGNAFDMPWAHGQRIYSVIPTFIWQSPRHQPEYRHDVIREFRLGWELQQYQRHRTLRGYVRAMAGKLGFYLVKCFRPVPIGLLAIAGLFSLRADRWTRWAVIGFVLYAIPVFLSTGNLTHYVAAALPLVFVLVVSGLRRLRLWQPHPQLGGKFLAHALLLLCAVSPVLWSVKRALIPNRLWGEERARILDTLQRDGQKHLVVVRYDPSHVVYDEWVYNEAGIDGATVVWAREMGPAQDRELLDYFKDRRVWLLEADKWPPRLSPFPPATQ